jgi:hypothetical protein
MPLKTWTKLIAESFVKAVINQSYIPTSSRRRSGSVGGLGVAIPYLFTCADGHFQAPFF